MQDHPAQFPDVAPPPPPPPGPPTPPGVPRLAGVPGLVEIHRAAQAQREILGDQYERLSERRGELSERLSQEGLDATDRTGLTRQLTEIDQRLSDLNRQIAEADARVVQTAVAGALGPPDAPPPVQHDPPAAMIITIVFTVFVLFPIAIAFARRIWRRSSVAPSVVPPELTDRLGRLEQAVETIAVEVERIGEGQRFVTKLFAESPNGRPLASGVPEPETQPIPVGRARR